jgi:hypothetical protein
MMAGSHCSGVFSSESWVLVSVALNPGLRGSRFEEELDLQRDFQSVLDGLLGDGLVELGEGLTLSDRGLARLMQLRCFLRLLVLEEGVGGDVLERRLELVEGAVMEEVSQ